MSPELRNSFGKISLFFSKYHYTIFLVLSVCGIAVGIVSLISVVQMSSTIQDSQLTDSAKVNEATIQRIRELDSNPSTSLDLPTDQRINLFAE